MTAPAVCFSIPVPGPLALRLGACDLDFGSRQGPFEGPATRKASGSAGGYLLNLNKIQGLGAPVASIGGAGTFDGVFLVGIVAVLLASLMQPGARQAV